MRDRSHWMAAALVSVALGVSGCSAGAAEGGEGGEEAAKVEAVAGSEVKRVTLTERAAQRLDIQTVTIGAPPPSLAGQPDAVALVPYSAVLYSPDGATWVYTVQRPLTYMREKVVVATVRGTDGAQALLSTAPPAGTAIVSVGVVELYGAELGVGE